MENLWDYISSSKLSDKNTIKNMDGAYFRYIDP